MRPSELVNVTSELLERKNKLAEQVATLTTQRDMLVKALQFYADAWNCKPNKRYGGLEWSPKEELLDDCGNKAKEALSQTKEGV